MIVNLLYENFIKNYLLFLWILNNKLMSIIINNKSNFFENNLSESPIEKIFLTEIVKYLENGTEIFEQKSFKTKIGRFRVDFLIKNGCTEYIVELDGKDYHELSKDLWRDSFLLGEKKVNSIIRIKGRDVVFNLNECFYFLSKIRCNSIPAIINGPTALASSSLIGSEI